MSTPKPGEIRCPTCHRSTPPAAYCTQCGSPIPAGARARPRGMDREELQARIRARRLGDDEPWRRGSAAGGGAYEQYRPDPADAGRREAPSAGSDAPRVDRFASQPVGRGGDEHPEAPADRAAAALEAARDGRQWARPTSGDEVDRSSAAAAPPPATPPDRQREDDRELAAPVPPPYVAPQPAAEPRVDNYDDAAYDPEDYPYEYDEYEEDRRRGGTGALAVLGFLGLGVLALLAGAVLAGMFTSDDGVGIASPSPAATAAETAEPTLAPTASPAATAPATGTAPPGSPGEGEGPVIFPDGFSAEAEPCDELPSSPNGCNSSGATNDGSLFIWIGFTNGSGDDVINVEILDPSGAAVGEGSIDLGEIGCSPACPAGWAYMGFSGLGPGTYDVVVRRNSEFADRTEFQVQG